jgi:hypothetical protein
VTADQLRSRLDRRELLLRQRFENLVAEMTATRDLLARSQTPLGQAEAAPTGDAASDTAGNEDSNSARSAAVTDAAQTALARLRLRLARVQQNVERASHETVDVADAFADIRQELINNRIDTKALTTRLEEGITKPLRDVGQNMLPAVLLPLAALASAVDKAVDRDARIADALGRADAAILAMKRILDRMLELESYNEVLDLLHSLIQDQRELNEQTREQRKEQLRSLLED